MLRRRPQRLRRAPAWDLVPALPSPSPRELEKRRSHPGWLVAAGLLVLLGWWVSRLPPGATASIPRSKPGSDIQSVEISPTPPQPQVSQEIQEAIPTNAVPTTQAPVPSSPSVGWWTREPKAAQETGSPDWIWAWKERGRG